MTATTLLDARAVSCQLDDQLKLHRQRRPLSMFDVKYTQTDTVLHMIAKDHDRP